MSKQIKENSFDAAGGGTAGSINVQPSLGNHASPNHYYNDPINTHGSNKDKYYDPNVTGQPEKTIWNQTELNQLIDKMFKGKEKPTIDDVYAGIQYETGKMIHKDIQVAKRIVIDNLIKHGAKFYTKLGMLNIGMDDEESDKSKVMKERVNILNQMIAEKEAKRTDLRLNDAIQDILKEKRDYKSLRSEELFKKHT
jgi:hypothetical protein